MRLFYFVTDSYPAWRVDLAELFSYELKKLGLHIDWSMRRENTGFWGAVNKKNEKIFLPLAISNLGLVTPIIRRFGEFIGEIYLMFKLIFGQKYDVIQVRDDRYTAAFFAWIAARIRGSKFVYWVSFPFPENDLEKAQLTKGFRRFIFKLRGTLAFWWLYRVVLVLADHIFVQTEGMKLNIISYGLPAHKMTAVPMSVSIRLLDWIKSTTVEIEPDSVVYLGTFARSRRLDMILESFILVQKVRPNAKLYMVGRGDTPQDRLYLENIATRLNVKRNVIFTGFLPIEQAWEVAAKGAVCISPIYPNFIFLQGSPTKLYEYMALSRPVIANEHPEQTIALSESGAGLCVPWQAEDFADAIIYLLNNPEEAERMGKLGPAWVANNRQYDLVAAKVFGQYQKIINQSC